MLSPLRSVPLALLLLSALALSAAAQPVPAATTEHVLARPGYPTIAVYVMGQVATPGKWRVEPGTPLLDLLAAARPSNLGMDQPRVDERTSVRLHRAADDGSRRLALDSEIGAVLTSPQAAMPLAEGDLVEVVTVVTEIPEARRGMSFQEVLGIVTSVASLAVLVITLVRN